MPNRLACFLLFAIIFNYLHDNIITEWDGLTSVFIKLVDKDKELLEDSYIRNWYNVSKKCLHIDVRTGRK